MQSKDTTRYVLGISSHTDPTVCRYVSQIFYTYEEAREAQDKAFFEKGLITAVVVYDPEMYNKI